MAISLNKQVTNIVAVAGDVTLTLSDVDGILVGAKVDVAGFPTTNWNGNNLTVTAVNTTALTITYHSDNLSITSQAADANCHLQCNWIDDAFVEEMLGFTPSGGDLTFLSDDVKAANDWAFRKRSEAGYNPHPGYPAGHDVKMGTGLYAMMLYRERGTSGDQYAGYPTMGQYDRPVSIRAHYATARLWQGSGCLMAASGVLADAVNAVTAQLTTLGVAWTTDPRNIRPGAVLVDLPQSDNFTFNVANVNMTLHICAAPPANQDAANSLLTIADAIMNSPIAITAMRPGFLSVGGQDLPTYDLTVAVAVRRN